MRFIPLWINKMNEKEDTHEQMEQIYSKIHPTNIPWNIAAPPELLVKAVETGKIKSCQAVDLGCGMGNYSVWLAQQGFEVTGFDFSEHAIKQANELAESKGTYCRFIAANLLGDLKPYHDNFDFAFEWEVLHHIFPENRSCYMQNVSNILRLGAIYLSVCFSEKDSDFGGKGKYRKTPLGTTLYFSSEKELRELFDSHFKIMDLTSLEICGKYGPHMANVAWLENK